MTVLLSERTGASPIALEPIAPVGVRTDALGPPAPEIQGPPDTPPWVREATRFAERFAGSRIALVRLAQAELAAGETERAVERAREAIRGLGQGEDVTTTLFAARVLATCGLFEEAESALGELYVEGPLAALAAAIAIERNDLDGAERRLGDTSSAEAVKLRGWIALQRDKYHESIRLYRKALDAAPATPGVLANIGYAHAALGELKKGIKETRTASALAPANRAIGLNLAGFLISAARFDEALKEIKRLQALFPDDVKLRFAESSVYGTAGNLERVHKILKSMRTSVWAYATADQQHELVARTAFVEWQLRKKTRVDVIDVIERELKASDYEAVAVAKLLPSILETAADGDRLGQLLEELRGKHAPAKLLSLSTHLHLLRSEFDEATETALAWAVEEPFNGGAAGVAVYLITEARGDYKSSIALGREALRRVPSAEILRNNVAYALILDGQPRKARELLRDLEESVYVCATRAMADLAEGKLQAGLEGYQRAYELAQESPRTDLASFVRINELFAIRRFVPSAPDLQELSLEAQVALLRSFLDDPRVKLLQSVAEREGVELEDAVERDEFSSK